MTSLITNSPPSQTRRSTQPRCPPLKPIGTEGTALVPAIIEGGEIMAELEPLRPLREFRPCSVIRAHREASAGAQVDTQPGAYKCWNQRSIEATLSSDLCASVIETSRPKARDAPRYPCPAYSFVNGSLSSKQGCAPKGTKSCRT